MGENLRCAWGGAPAGHKASARAAPPVHGARSMPLPASSSRVMSSRNTTLTSSDLERSRMPVWGPVGGGRLLLSGQGRNSYRVGGKSYWGISHRVGRESHWGDSDRGEGWFYKGGGATPTVSSTPRTLFFQPFGLFPTPAPDRSWRCCHLSLWCLKGGTYNKKRHAA